MADDTHITSVCRAELLSVMKVGGARLADVLPAAPAEIHEDTRRHIFHPRSCSSSGSSKSWYSSAEKIGNS